MMFGIILVFILVFSLIVIISIASSRSHNKMVDDVKNQMFNHIQNQQINNPENFEGFQNATKHTQTSVTTKTFVNGEEVDSLPENISGILDNVENIIKSAGLGNLENDRPREEYITCEYCGTENEIRKRKCISCGANLRKKK